MTKPLTAYCVRCWSAVVRNGDIKALEYWSPPRWASLLTVLILEGYYTSMILIRLCDMSPMINTWTVATSWTHRLPLECTYWWDYIGIYGVCKCTIISSNSITLYVCRLTNELWITSALEDSTNMEEREWLSFVHSSALAVFGGSKPIAFLNTLHSSVPFPLYARACACHGQVKCAVLSSQCLFWLVCFTCIVCISWLRWNYIEARSKVHI